MLDSIGDVRTIVVDNASLDGTLAALRRHDVEVIANAENRMLSPAWAQGLERSDADYVALVNPDCEILTKGWADKLEAFLEAHPDVAIVAPRLLDPDGAVQFSCHEFRSKAWAISQVMLLPGIRAKLGRPKEWRWEPGWPRDTLRDIDVLSGAFLVIRRSALDAIGGIDQGFTLYWEEDDLCLRARRAGYRNVLHPEVEVIHAWAQSTRQVDSSVLEPHIRNGFDRYFAKHHGRAFATSLRAIRKLTRR